ncbi:unnamed protein product [Phaeothamnion confervicola]
MTRRLCKEVNEHFICPMLSDVITITTEGSQVSARVHVKFLQGKLHSLSFQCAGQSPTFPLFTTYTCCQDGATFSLPESDCAKLPLVHSTAEELARYLYGRIVTEFGLEYFVQRHVHTMEVAVAEMPRQEALYRRRIPATLDELRRTEEAAAAAGAAKRPWPCLGGDNG